MRSTILACAVVILAAGPTFAESGAPASPSGAPAAAAQEGSSMAGKDAAAQEMKSHNDNVSRQNKMDDPHKQTN